MKLNQWTRVPAQWSKMVMRKGTRCGIVIGYLETGNYIAMAFETPGSEPAQILEQHAHEALGEFPSLGRAKAAGDKYLKAWIAGKKKAAQCKCPTIDAVFEEHVIALYAETSEVRGYVIARRAIDGTTEVMTLRRELLERGVVTRVRWQTVEATIDGCKLADGSTWRLFGWQQG